jgi:polysaccharide biosynthesis PFTS motif protein
MEINTNHINIKFGRVISSVKNYLSKKINSSFNYSQEAILERLVQYFAFLSLPAYSKSIKKDSKPSLIDFPDSSYVINLKTASLEIETGRVLISRSKIIRQVGIFLIHWSICLLAIIFPKKSYNNSKIVLVYGVGEESIISNNTSDKFISYCKKSKIIPLRTNNNLFIECSSYQKLTNSENYYFCKRPLLNSIRRVRISFSSRMKIFIIHILLILKYSIAAFRSPHILFISKEIAYTGIVKELDKQKKIEAFIFTCSSYLDQPLWTRELVNSKVHMIWYAQAWKPNTYKVDKLESHGPNLPWIRVDTHWVWTNKFAEYLVSLGLQSKFEVVGSILWYLPILKKKTKSHFHISIFDISPFSDEVALEYGQITNYNNPNNLFAFLDNTIEVINNIGKELSVPIEISLKQKRSFKSIYSKEYYSHVEQLSNKGIIELVNPSANIYEMISSSHVVIAYPFTSPVYVANELNVPSIFYDPTDSICNHNFSDLNSLIDFVSTKKLLHESILSLLIKSSNN